MIETRMIDAAALQDIGAWERANKAKLLTAEIFPGGLARAEVLPVADLDWWINVWNCKGELVLGETYIDDLFDFDPDALAALIDQVVYNDHDSGLTVSGQYYPLSETSQQLFTRLMETARPKNTARTEAPGGFVEVETEGDTDPAEVARNVKRIIDGIYQGGGWLVEKDDPEGEREGDNV